MNLRAISARPYNAVNPGLDDSSGVVHEAAGGLVIAQAQYDIPAEAAREWAVTLLAAVKPEKVGSSEKTLIAIS